VTGGDSVKRSNCASLNRCAGRTNGMSSSAHLEPASHADAERDYAVAAAPLVYTAVGVGLAVSLVALLIARGSFGFGTAALALLLVAPYLLYARLALSRPGAEAVLGGVLLLAVGSWGAISAIGVDDAGAFIRLPLELIVLELVVFLIGGLLRSVLPARDEREPSA
jgi:hypothetical protein